MLLVVQASIYILQKSWSEALMTRFNLGFIGGSVLSRLFYHHKVHKSHVTVLVRSKDKADKLKSFGFNSVIGSTGDRELLGKLAEQAQVVVSCVRLKQMSCVYVF